MALFFLKTTPTEVRKSDRKDIITLSQKFWGKWVNIQTPSELHPNKINYIFLKMSCLPIAIANCWVLLIQVSCLVRLMLFAYDARESLRLHFFNLYLNSMYKRIELPICSVIANCWVLLIQIYKIAKKFFTRFILLS